MHNHLLPLCSDLDSPKRHNGIPDDGIVSCVTALGCLRSPPISSIIADVKNAKSNQGQHRCLPKGATASSGPSTALDDLIHLPGPLTEDAVLKCLQARFCAKQYHVSLRFFLPPFTTFATCSTWSSEPTWRETWATRKRFQAWQSRSRVPGAREIPLDRAATVPRASTR